MMKTSPTSSLSTAKLVGLFDELNKIAEVKQDQPLKKTLKNIALASLGGAAGTGVVMLGHQALKSTLGERYEKILPATRMKYIAPAIGIGSMAITAAMLALQHEMTKKEEKKDV
jgi:hypothetical protein